MLNALCRRCKTSATLAMQRRWRNWERAEKEKKRRKSRRGEIRKEAEGAGEFRRKEREARERQKFVRESEGGKAKKSDFGGVRRDHVTVGSFLEEQGDVGMKEGKVCMSCQKATRSVSGGWIGAG